MDESNAKFKVKGAKSWPICISNAINKFLDVLADEFSKHLPPFHNVDHKIEVVLRSTPPFKLPYWLIKKELHEFNAQIKDLMEWGYIRPSKSPYGLPILFVDKKDGKLCMCIDYHTLNKITIKNNYPLPWIHDLFYCLNGASYFTHIKLKSGYFRFVLDTQMWKRWPWRKDMIHMSFWLMSFGLCSTPSIFTTLMNSIFHKKLNEFVIIYINDILVY